MKNTRVDVHVAIEYFTHLISLVACDLAWKSLTYRLDNIFDKHACSFEPFHVYPISRSGRKGKTYITGVSTTPKVQPLSSGCAEVLFADVISFVSVDLNTK